MGYNVIIKKKQLLDFHQLSCCYIWHNTYSRHWQVVDLSRYLINFVQYCMNIVSVIIHQTYMEADLYVRRIADVYEREEQSLLNILSVVESLGTERLHFRSIPAEPVNFKVRTASRHPRSSLQGSPGGGGSISVMSSQFHQPVTVLRSRHDDKPEQAENTPVSLPPPLGATYATYLWQAEVTRVVVEKAGSKQSGLLKKKKRPGTLRRRCPLKAAELHGLNADVALRLCPPAPFPMYRRKWKQMFQFNPCS